MEIKKLSCRRRTKPQIARETREWGDSNFDKMRRPPGVLQRLKKSSGEVHEKQLRLGAKRLLRAELLQFRSANCGAIASGRVISQIPRV